MYSRIYFSGIGIKHVYTKLSVQSEFKRNYLKDLINLQLTLPFAQPDSSEDDDSFLSFLRVSPYNEK